MWAGGPPAGRQRGPQGAPRSFGDDGEGLYEDSWRLGGEGDSVADAHNQDTFGCDAPVGEEPLNRPAAGRCCC